MLLGVTWLGEPAGGVRMRPVQISVLRRFPSTRTRSLSWPSFGRYIQPWHQGGMQPGEEKLGGVRHTRPTGVQSYVVQSYTALLSMRVG
jgi:hypothetical protein